MRDQLISLYLRNFRNYEEADVSFSSHINFIHGDNAQGKTNLLEAIYLLSTGKSFRTIHLSELIGEGTSFFYLHAHFIKDLIPQTVSLSFDGLTKKMNYNNTSYNHFTNLLGLLPTVLLAPEDIELITASPGVRRRFLDIHIGQIDPLYIYHLGRYAKALKQRNCLLKQRRAEGIESWEYILLQSASYIQKKRSELIDSLRIPSRETMAWISQDKDTLELSYLPSLVHDYQKLRPKELAFGLTLAGAHRDDLQILINGKDSKIYASQGQKRSAVIALRLAEWAHFQHVNETPPLLGIDDFGVHLDDRRNDLLLSQLPQFGQVFVTSPHLLKTGSYSSFQVEKGSIITN
jgi:DNA replication and repair protein RecF